MMALSSIDAVIVITEKSECVQTCKRAHNARIAAFRECDDMANKFIDHRCDVCGKYPKKQRKDTIITTCTPCCNFIGRAEVKAKRMFGE